VTPTDLLAATDGHSRAAWLSAPSRLFTEANGVPRNYHRVEDTVDAIDTAMVAGRRISVRPSPPRRAHRLAASRHWSV
jgi:hypothetical protein